MPKQQSTVPEKRWCAARTGLVTFRLWTEHPAETFSWKASQTNGRVRRAQTTAVSRGIPQPANLIKEKARHDFDASKLRACFPQGATGILQHYFGRV